MWGQQHGSSKLGRSNIMDIHDGPSSSSATYAGSGTAAGRRPLLRTLLTPSNMKALTYGLMNIVSASGIVFANKAVFQTYGFHFTFALTEIHTIFTLLGMLLLARLRFFETKRLPHYALMQLAAAYVGYIVLCNLSLKVNTVGFYQVMKIAVAPTVIALDIVLFRRFPKPKIVASVLVVCLGIAVATVTDSQIIRNVSGIFVGMAATLVTALYQSWAGSKQKELRASSMQLLQAYTPHATLLLGVLVPMCEPVGWSAHHRTVHTLLGYHYTWHALLAIIVSAALGLFVSLSTFLVIGATSSLTYNVVGHLKTVIILTGGCLFFGDAMPIKKLIGVSIAMLGIVWYTQLKLAQAEATPSASGADGQQLKPLLPTSNPSGNRAAGMTQRFEPRLTAASAFQQLGPGLSSRRPLNVPPGGWSREEGANGTWRAQSGSTPKQGDGADRGMGNGHGGYSASPKGI